MIRWGSDQRVSQKDDAKDYVAIQIVYLQDACRTACSPSIVYIISLEPVIYKRDAFKLRGE
jgi:hypothetical protein